MGHHHCSARLETFGLTKFISRRLQRWCYSHVPWIFLRHSMGICFMFFFPRRRFKIRVELVLEGCFFCILLLGKKANLLFVFLKFDKPSIFEGFYLLVFRGIYAKMTWHSSADHVGMILKKAFGLFLCESDFFGYSNSCSRWVFETLTYITFILGCPRKSVNG